MSYHIGNQKSGSVASTWGHNMLEGKSKLVNRPTETAGKKYDKYYIYIPAGLVKDSAFSFKPGGELLIRLDPEKNEIIVSKQKSE